MSDKLKACPFCGSTHIQPAPLSDYEWYRCGDCDALSGRGGADGWNTRPLEDAANARAEAAEARVPELQAALADIAHGPVGTWNEPQHAAEVIKHMMRVASDALKGGEE